MTIKSTLATPEQVTEKTVLVAKEVKGYYFWKAVMWLFLNSVYGMVPLLVIWLGSNVVKDPTASKVHAESQRFIHDCGLMFIFVVIMGSATIDFFMSKAEFHKRFVFLVPMVTSLLLLTVCFIAFIKILNNENIPVDILPSTFNFLQWLVIILSSFFTIIVKSNLLKKEAL